MPAQRGMMVTTELNLVRGLVSNLGIGSSNKSLIFFQLPCVNGRIAQEEGNTLHSPTRIGECSDHGIQAASRIVPHRLVYSVRQRTYGSLILAPFHTPLHSAIALPSILYTQ